jgi:hypothetical protein
MGCTMNIKKREIPARKPTWKQGIDERAVEITAEVHEAKGDENFPIGS